MDEPTGSESESEIIDVFYMPWLALRKEMTIGRVVFTPVQRLLESEAETDVATFLGRLFRCYVDEVGKPVPAPTICRLVDRSGLPKLCPEEAIEIRRAADALCLAAVLELARLRISRDYYGYWSTQSFLLMRHTGKADRDKFTFAGVINCSYDHYRCSKPFGLDCAAHGFSGELIDASSRLFACSNTKLKERVFRCLEWARFAQDDTDAVTEASKIVMMGTAFEILLGITGSGNKTERLMTSVDSLCGVSTSAIKRDVLYENKPLRGFSLMGWWMRDFYKLRNAIVHGDSIEQERLYVAAPSDESDGIRHREVAVVVLWDCMWRLLCEDRVVGDGCRRRVEIVRSTGCTEPEDELVKLYATWDTGTRDVYERLGWLVEPELP